MDWQVKLGALVLAAVGLAGCAAQQPAASIAAPVTLAPGTPAATPRPTGMPRASADRATTLQLAQLAEASIDYITAAEATTDDDGELRQAVEEWATMQVEPLMQSEAELRAEPVLLKYASRVASIAQTASDGDAALLRAEIRALDDLRAGLNAID